SLSLFLSHAAHSPHHPLTLPGTSATPLYSLSLHDALPISVPGIGVHEDHGPHEREEGSPGIERVRIGGIRGLIFEGGKVQPTDTDRKSTRLNSSHGSSSYAVFCLKKKNITTRSDLHCVGILGCGITGSKTRSSHAQKLLRIRKTERKYERIILFNASLKADAQRRT